LEAIATGATVSQAAKAGNVGRTTVYDKIANDPKFAAAFDNATEQGTDLLEAEATRRAISGSDTMLIFLLKARRPRRFRDNATIEHTGPNGGPIQQNVTLDLSGFSDEEIIRLGRAVSRDSTRSGEAMRN
jgi:hypothetical protein